MDEKRPLNNRACTNHDLRCHFSSLQPRSGEQVKVSHITFNVFSPDSDGLHRTGCFALIPIGDDLNNPPQTKNSLQTEIEDLFVASTMLGYLRWAQEIRPASTSGRGSPPHRPLGRRELRPRVPSAGAPVQTSSVRVPRLRSGLEAWRERGSQTCSRGRSFSQRPSRKGTPEPVVVMEIVLQPAEENQERHVRSGSSRWARKNT